MSAAARRQGVLRAVENTDRHGLTPPLDLEAERVILSDLLDAERPTSRVAQIREWLRPEHFFWDVHGSIYEAITAIDDAGVRPDTALVTAWLSKHGRIKGELTPALVKSIAIETPYHQNIDAHLMVVLRLAQRREMIKLADTVKAEAYDGADDDAAWLRSCALRVTKIADQFDQAAAITGGRSAAAAVQKVIAHVERKGKLIGISTGFGPLDEITAGLHPTDITLITAKSGGGKTALAMNVAMNVASARDDEGYMRNGVLVFSIEMPHDQLGARMVSALGRVDMNAMRKGRVTDYDVRRSIEAVQTLADYPMQIDDSKHVTPGAIRARARRAQESFAAGNRDLVLIVIDYVQLINGRELVEKNANRERELNEVIREITKLADELKVAVLLLAQLNDDGEIRESRAILHFAHNWWDIERDEKEKPKGEFRPREALPEAVTIRLRKHRNGPAPADAELWFHPKYVLFAETDS